VANFLISTMPASGHVNPALPLAAELVRRGHQVWWHTGTGYADQVAAAGAHLVPFVHTLDFDQLPVQPDPGDKGMAAGVTALRKLFIDRMPGQYQDYRAITNQFPADVVLADLCCLGAGALHDAGGPVYATLGINPLVTPDPEIPRWGKGAPPATSPARRLGNRLEHLLGRVLFMPKPTALLNQARAGIGLPPLPPGSNLGDVLRSPFLHLMPTTEAFEYPRKHLPPQVCPPASPGPGPASTCRPTRRPPTRSAPPSARCCGSAPTATTHGGSRPTSPPTGPHRRRPRFWNASLRAGLRCCARPALQGTRRQTPPLRSVLHMARIWTFDQAGLAASHAEAGMAEVIDPLLEALANLPLWALAGAVAVVMALEASLLTGLFGP
jgi:hypothetical protein